MGRNNPCVLTGGTRVDFGELDPSTLHAFSAKRHSEGAMRPWESHKEEHCFSDKGIATS